MIIELAMALAVQQGQAAFADLSYVTVRTYVVQGRNPRQVRSAIDAARPVLGDGQGRDAATNWTYGVRWMNDGSGVCRPDTAEVTYAITVTLPELGDQARLNEQAMERWNAWAAYLAAHERRRVEGVVAGLEAMEASMRAAPDCAAMTARQDEAVLAIARQSQALDQALAEQYRRDRGRLPRFP